AGAGDRHIAARPALRVIGPESRVLVLRADSPDPTFFHESVLRDLTADFSALAVGAGERELPHAGLGTLAVLRNMDDVLVEEVLRDLPLMEAGGTVDIETA